MSLRVCIRCDQMHDCISLCRESHKKTGHSQCSSMVDQFLVSQLSVCSFYFSSPDDETQVNSKNDTFRFPNQLKSSSSNRERSYVFKLFHLFLLLARSLSHIRYFCVTFVSFFGVMRSFLVIVVRKTSSNSFNLTFDIFQLHCQHGRIVFILFCLNWISTTQRRRQITS